MKSYYDTIASYPITDNGDSRISFGFLERLNYRGIMVWSKKKKKVHTHTYIDDIEMENGLYERKKNKYKGKLKNGKNEKGEKKAKKERERKVRMYLSRLRVIEKIGF